MNRKKVAVIVLVLLSIGTVISVYAGTVGVNNLFGFTNGYGFTDLNSTFINAATEFYRNGVNYTQFIELLIPNHDQDVNTTDAVTFASVNGTVGYFMGAVNVTPVLQYPQQEASYIIWVDGGVYYEKNTESGEVIGYGTAAAAIQDAVDNTDGLIVIRNGDYIVSTTIELADDTYITGEGWKTVLVVGNAGMTAIFDGATAPNYYDQISISNMKLDGNNDTGKQVMGLRLIRCRNVLVDRIYFIDFGNNAIDLTTPKETVISSVIQNCKFEDIFNYAITFDTGASGTVVQNNIIDNATTGIRLYQGWFYKVLNNHFINCDRGLDVDQSNNSIIYANTFSNNDLNDLRVVSTGPPCVNITVTDNMFSGLVELGVDDYLYLNMNNNFGGIRETINATNIYLDQEIYVQNLPVWETISGDGFPPSTNEPLFTKNSTFPSTPVAGDLFYNTATFLFYFYNSTHWVSTSIGASPTGDPPVGTNATVLWWSRMENGTSEWTDGGGWYGILTHDPPDSEIDLAPNYAMGRNWFRVWINNPNVASDPWTSYKCRAEIMRRGNLNNNGSWVTSQTDLYYGVRIILPANFTVSTGTGDWAEGVSLVQLHEGPSAGWAGGLRMWANDSPEEDLLIATNIYNYTTSQMDLTTQVGGINFTTWLGKPFTYVMHMNQVQNGEFQAWINNTLMVNVTGDFRMRPDSTALGYKSRYFQIGLYCGIGQPEKMAFYTDAIVATDTTGIENFLDIDITP